LLAQPDTIVAAATAMETFNGASFILQPSQGNAIGGQMCRRPCLIRRAAQYAGRIKRRKPSK
jgi:hypothetical protein